jgi:carbon monoxide dehydrogenase subunit G
MRSVAILALLGCLALLESGCAGALGDGAMLSPKSSADVAISSHERARLLTGAVVTQPLDFERNGAHYVGGVATGLVPAAAEEVLAALDDVSALRAMLPRTKRATLVDAHGATRRIELRQGNALVDATYTVTLAPAGAPGELHFQLDASRPHGIEDVYGYFKVERLDDRHSMVTLAAAVDVGSGLTAALFGKRVQDVILSAPVTMRDYFADADRPPQDSVVARNDGR